MTVSSDEKRTIVASALEGVAKAFTLYELINPGQVYTTEQVVQTLNLTREQIQASDTALDGIKG